MAAFKNNGKLKLLIIVGARPETIRLSEVIKKCRRYFDCLLVHAGRNYDYSLNGAFFKDLEFGEPDVCLDAVDVDLGESMGNIIAKSYGLMAEISPDAVLVLGDTNSCLSVIGAKRLPEEVNRRIVDAISDVNMAYSEYARSYLKEPGCGALVEARNYAALRKTLRDVLSLRGEWAAGHATGHAVVPHCFLFEELVG